MGDSCRYLTLLHFTMQTKRAHRYRHALFFNSSFKYTLSVGSRPLISISAMDISTLVGNHQLEVAFLQSPFAIPTYEAKSSAFNSNVMVLVSPG